MPSAVGHLRIDGCMLAAVILETLFIGELSFFGIPDGTIYLTLHVAQAYIIAYLLAR